MEKWIVAILELLAGTGAGPPGRGIDEGREESGGPLYEGHPFVGVAKGAAELGDVDAVTVSSTGDEGAGVACRRESDSVTATVMMTTRIRRDRNAAPIIHHLARLFRRQNGSFSTFLGLESEGKNPRVEDVSIRSREASASTEGQSF